jgi:hypothetical protein
MKSTAKKDRGEFKPDLPLEAIAVAAHNRIAFESPPLRHHFSGLRPLLANAPIEISGFSLDEID